MSSAAPSPDGGRTRAAMYAQRVEAYIQEVANVATLVAALGNANVTQIHLTADLLLEDAGTRIDGLVLNRNVHIKGVGCSGEVTLVRTLVHNPFP